MNKHQLTEVLEVINQSKPFMKSDSQYIRWRKVKEWVEDEIREKRLEERTEFENRVN